MCRTFFCRQTIVEPKLRILYTPCETSRTQKPQTNKHIRCGKKKCIIPDMVSLWQQQQWCILKNRFQTRFSSHLNSTAYHTICTKQYSIIGVTHSKKFTCTSSKQPVKLLSKYVDREIEFISILVNIFLHKIIVIFRKLLAPKDVLLGEKQIWKHFAFICTMLHSFRNILDVKVSHRKKELIF